MKEKKFAFGDTVKKVGGTICNTIVNDLVVETKDGVIFVYQINDAFMGWYDESMIEKVNAVCPMCGREIKEG